MAEDVVQEIPEWSRCIEDHHCNRDNSYNRNEGRPSSGRFLRKRIGPKKPMGEERASYNEQRKDKGVSGISEEKDQSSQPNDGDRKKTRKATLFEIEQDKRAKEDEVPQIGGVTEAKTVTNA